MRLFLQSIPILSLFATSSHAFAPPTFARTSATTSRLAASNELSGMLSEYSSSSSSASAASTAAADASSTIAEKAVVVVATPPPPPPPPAAAAVAEAADSGMDALSKAASAAQDAADQAAAAAAAVAANVKGVATTKAAATAAAGAGGIKFQPLVKPAVGGVMGANVVPAKMPFQVDPSKVNTDGTFDASVRARENMALLKANLLGGIGSVKEASSSVVDVKADDLSLGINFDAATITPAIADLASSLHLQEYGGWYVAAAVAIYASQQREAGREDASAKFEAELASANEKASEAALAAGLAARGANTAKELAVKMEKGLKKDGGKALLESSRSKMVEMEKEIMEKEMRALQAEVASLRNQLAQSEGGKKKKKGKTKTVLTEIEKEYPTKVFMERDPDEDVRIIEILKAMDKENQTAQKKAAAEAEKKREEEAKFVAAQKKKAASKKKTKGAEAAQAKAGVAKTKKAATKKAKKASTKVKSGAKRKTAVKKAATKKTAAATKKIVTETKKTVTEPKKTVTVTKRAPASTGAIDDWASLAESTLKRKTVAQLTEYLTGKGVTATDSSGKSLKKAKLLEAVKSL